MDETCGFMTRYLLSCIHENVQDDDGDVASGYEAAWNLAACLKHWAGKLPETQPVMSKAASRLPTRTGRLMTTSEIACSNGTLEHALEVPAVRPYFAAWKDDPGTWQAVAVGNGVGGRARRRGRQMTPPLNGSAGGYK